MSTGQEIGVRGFGHYSSLPGAPLPQDLDPLLGRRIRKIGRFIKLALAGATAALKQSGLGKLPAERTGVFLGTGLGNLPELIEFSETVLDDDQALPSAIQFANSVGNSGAFYIAQTLEVTGPVLAVTQDEVSFEAALLTARALLVSGELDYAMVGGADVFTPDAAAQRTRMGHPADGDLALGEGTGWLLLERLCAQSLARVEHLAVESRRPVEELARGLSASGPGALWLGTRQAAQAPRWLDALPPGTSRLEIPSGAFPTESALAPAAFLVAPGPAVLHAVSSTREGHVGCLTLRRTGSTGVGA